MAKLSCGEKCPPGAARYHPEKRETLAIAARASCPDSLRDAASFEDKGASQVAVDHREWLAPVQSPAAVQEVTLEDIRAAKFEFPAEKRAWLCKQLTDLRALLLARNIKQALDLIDRIRARTVGASSSSVNRVMEVIAREVRQARWQGADDLAGDLIDAVFAFTSEGVRSWAAYRKKLDLRFFEHVPYIAPMTIALYKYDSLIVRLRSGGEDRYRLEMHQPSNAHARLVFTTIPRAKIVRTRLEWSVEGANTTGIIEDKGLAIDMPREGACRVGFAGREGELCCFTYDGASPKRAALYVLSGEGKLVQVYSDCPDAEEPASGTAAKNGEEARNGAEIGNSTRVSRIKYG
jgi:hypothetical protein